MTPIACPRCRGQMYYMPEYAGQVVACPHCSAPLQMVLPAGRDLATSVPETPAFISDPVTRQSSAATDRRSTASPSRPKPLVTTAAFLVISGAVITALLAYGIATRRGGNSNVSPATTQMAAESAASINPLPVLAKPGQSASSSESFSRSPADQNRAPDRRSVETPELAPKALIEASGPTYRQPRAVPPTAIARVNIPAAPGANAKPPQPVPPAKPASLPVLAQTPAHIELPTLASPDPVDVLRLTGAEPSRVQLHLLSSAAAVPEAAVLFIETAETAVTAEHQSTVFYTPDPTIESPEREAIGIFTASADRLTFQWNEPLADVALRRQLKNCLLEIRHDNEVARIAMRPTAPAEPLKVDLAIDRVSQEFALTDPPKSATVFVELTGRGFPVDATDGTLQKVAKLGSEQFIPFSRLPGAELSLRLITQADAVILSVAPIFRERNAKFPLSRRQLEATTKGVNASLLRSKNELTEQSRLIGALQAEIRREQKTPPASQPDQVRKQLQLNSLQSKLKRASTKVASLQRQIPEFEARIAAIPKIEAFMNSLDGRELDFHIYAECGSQRLSLVKSRVISAE